jgi:YHS domain-containing protein
MVLRYVLELVLTLVVARAMWRLIGGLIAGVAGGTPTRPPQRSVPMVRDPVCGTFVLPDRAVTLTDGREQLFFCSTTCRDAHRARIA